MDKIFIFGHKKPDTDSVCGAISLCYLKKQLGINAEPRILSEINPETEFALKTFNVSVPKYLNDVKVQLKDTKYKKNYVINENASIYSVYNYMNEKGITGIPLVDDNKRFKGYVSLKEIANELIVSSSNYLNTSFDNISETLNSTRFLKFDEQIEGNIMAVALPYRMFIESIPLDKNSILIVGDREHIIDHALKSKVKLLIIIRDRELTEKEKQLAQKNKVNVIITPYNTFKTSKIITLSNPIKIIKRNSSAICFNPNDYLSDFIEVCNKLKHTNYPIVNNKGICDGMLRITETGEYTKKKVILVDHNDPIQSVDGINEAEILEVVDHHNIGEISTHSPINFRAMAVGSVNTVIRALYKEHGIKIPSDIAGLMLSGIISDTLLLASPTTTDLDRETANELAKIAKVNLQEYGVKLLESGVSIEGLTIPEVIYRDFKNYVVNDIKFAIGQVSTTDFSVYENKIDEYVKELDNIAMNNNYRTVCLFVTDIINNYSHIIYSNKSEDLIVDAFNLPVAKQGAILRGVISRKKQMLPPILDVLEKS